MKKYILLLFLLSTMLGKAQVLELSSGQQFIYDAVKDGILIAKQTYRLQDNETKKIFGLNNQKYFGVNYSIVLSLNGGYCAGPGFLYPWGQDKNYKEYEQNSQYSPLIYQTSVRNVTFNKFESFGYDESIIVETVPGHLYTWTSPDSNPGFQIDNNEGLKKGWLVWLMPSGDINECDTVDIHLNIYQSDIEMKKGINMYETGSLVSPPNTIGGFYILPQNAGIGKMNFALVGLLQKVDDKWMIITFNPNEEVEIVKPELTPVNQTPEKQ